MKKYLLAYQISGQTVGVDIQTWNVNDLQGNEPFKLILSGETIPSDYTDISSIVHWNQFGSSIANDYLVCKNAIKDVCDEIGWNNLTNEEKDLAIIYYAYPDFPTAIYYLMVEKGMSQAEAQYFLILEWHKHHKGVISSCKQRWYYVKIVVPMYLAFADCEDMLADPEVLSLISLLNDLGTLGTECGDTRDGIINFCDSTGTFTGKGMKEKGYTLLQGTWDEFILAIKKVMVEGIYEKYNDI